MKTLLIFLFLFVPLFSVAQYDNHSESIGVFETCPLDSTVDVGNYYYMNEHFDKALVFYRSCFDTISESSKYYDYVLFRLQLCYYRLDDFSNYLHCSSLLQNRLPVLSSFFYARDSKAYYQLDRYAESVYYGTKAWNSFHDTSYCCYLADSYFKLNDIAHGLMFSHYFLRFLANNGVSYHPFYMTYGSNLANINYRKAIDYYLKSLNNVDYSPAAICTLSIFVADFYSELGEFDNASVYITKANSIYDKYFRDDSNYEYFELGLLISMIRYYIGTHSYIKAYDGCVECLDLMYDNGSKIEVMNQFLQVFNVLEMYDNEIFLQILKANNDSWNNISPGDILFDRYYEFSKALAVSNFMIDDYQNAFNYSSIYYNHVKSNLLSMVSFLQYEDIASYWNRVSDGMDLFTECALSVDIDSALVYAFDSQLFSKGLLLASERQVDDIVKYSNSEYLNGLYDKYTDLKKQIVAERMRAHSTDALQDSLQDAEFALLDHCYYYGDLSECLKTTWTDVRDSLKSNDVAIEFFLTKRGKFGALILKKDFYYPQVVFLKDIDFRNRRDSRDIVSTYRNTDMYNAIWKPLERYFTKGCNVYFSPSQNLQTLAIENAIVDPGNKITISDKYRIYRVSSTKVLAEGRRTYNSKTAAVWGGIDYDASRSSINDVNVAMSDYFDDSDAERAYKPGYPVSFLDYSLDESEAITGNLKGIGFSVGWYKGANASEYNFKAMSGTDVRILHISTHGFVDPDAKDDASLDGAGLCLAGCNNSLNSTDDMDEGFLYASEISLMDLRNTDIVVLSACQTGLGYVSQEGVWGLQRGFKKAGANTIIMSLNNVSDAAASSFMQIFYRNLSGGMSKYDAFQSARAAVRNSKNYEDTDYWADFVMIDGL